MYKPSKRSRLRSMTSQVLIGGKFEKIIRIITEKILRVRTWGWVHYLIFRYGIDDALNIMEKRHSDFMEKIRSPFTKKDLEDFRRCLDRIND
jgi:hypothetical protein